MLPQSNPIEQLHSRASKIEFELEHQFRKLCQQRAKSNLINEGGKNVGESKYGARMPSTSDKRLGMRNNICGNPSLHGIQQNDENTERKFLQSTKADAELILTQYEQLLHERQCDSSRLQILRQSRKQAYEQILSLKNELSKNKQRIQRRKKLQQQLSRLESEHKVQAKTISKLQFAVNNSVRLQTQMAQKIQQIDDRQHAIGFKLQTSKEDETEAEASAAWKDSQRWSKLIAHKDNIEKHIQYRSEESNKQYKAKTEKKKQLQQKLQSIDQLYEDLNIEVKEQQYVIMEIMLKQKINGFQLHYGNHQQFGSNGKVGEEKQNDEDMEKQIRVFRNQIGIPSNTKINMNNEKDGKLVKYKTEVLNRQEVSDEQMKNTRKNPKSHLKRIKNEYCRKGSQRKYNKRKSLPSPSSFPVNQSELPKIKDKYDFKRHYPPLSSGPNIAKFKFKYRLNPNNAQSLSEAIEEQLKIPQFLRGGRIRTKEGYKYFGKVNRVASSRLERVKEETMGREFQTDYGERERLQIANVYDKVREKKSDGKAESQQQPSSEISLQATSQSQQSQENMNASQHIQLLLSKSPKTSTPLLKLQMQWRESDNENSNNEKKGNINERENESHNNYRNNINN